MEKLDIRPNDVLVIIDPQNDFCPGGALAVEGGDAIMGPIAHFAAAFANIVVTQDWHPGNHKSFASTHKAEPFSTTKLPYGDQVLWPNHCVQGTKGADFHKSIKPAVNWASVIIRKGMNPEVDSYSAFQENDKATSTGLGGYLRSRGLKRVFFVGLAYDFCVGFSAVDATRNEGLQAVVVKDLTRAIAMPLADDKTTVDEIEEQFRINNVIVVNRDDIEEGE